MLAKEIGSCQDNRHIHSLVRVNLQECGECGHFFITTYTRIENGDLVLEELELDLKIKSSRIRPSQPLEGQSRALPPESAEQVKAREETCW